MLTFWLVIILSTDPGVVLGVISTHKTMDECQAMLKQAPKEHAPKMGCLAVALGSMKEI